MDGLVCAPLVVHYVVIDEGVHIHVKREGKWLLELEMTTGGVWRLQEVFGDYRRCLATTGGDWRLQEVIGDYRRCLVVALEIILLLQVTDWYSFVF